MSPKLTKMINFELSVVGRPKLVLFDLGVVLLENTRIKSECVLGIR
jgi:hypothetical protein